MTGGDALGRNDIEAIYALLPMQQALLMRSSVPDVDDPGLLQVRFTLEGRIDVDQLRRAFDEVVASHPALRMTCRTSSSAGPRMVVWKTVSVPWEVVDWRDLGAERQADEMSLLLATDRRRGLDIGTTPAMRVTAVRTANERFEMVWTCHHLFGDGWSAAVVLRDLIGTYRNLATGAPRPITPPPDLYGRYLRWASDTTDDGDERYWTERLRGHVPHGRLQRTRTDKGALTVETSLGAELASAAESSVQRLGVTPNALIQGAWALTVAGLTGATDIVFGASVAGRAAPLEGIESLVGFLSRVLPVRVALPLDTAPDFLRALRDEQFEAQQHERTFLPDIERWHRLPGGLPLFQSLLVVENFPMQGIEADAVEEAVDEEVIALRGFRSDITSTLPITVAVAPSDDWPIVFTLDRIYGTEADAMALTSNFRRSIELLATDWTTPVRSFVDELAAVTFAAAETQVAPEASRVGRDVARDMIEQQLVDIWRNTIGVPSVGLHDDYFELGGTSMQAVRLFEEVEHLLGTRIPLASLLERPTVAQQADLIRDGLGDIGDGCLVPIQTDGARRPLLCVHAGDLHVLFYRHLAKRLGSDQPVYGLEPVGRNGDRPPLTTIEEMASVYIDEVRSLQPEGPYRILGYCLGGVIGFEMCRQLEASGQTVDLLALVDSGFPQPKPRASLPKRLRNTLSEKGPRYLADRAVGELRKRLARRRGGSGMERIGQEVAAPWVIEAGRRAFHAYVPGPVQTTVSLFRSRDSVERWPEQLLWQTVIDSIEVHEIEAGHSEILVDPGVRQVADILEPLLRS